MYNFTANSTKLNVLANLFFPLLLGAKIRLNSFPSSSLGKARNVFETMLTVEYKLKKGLTFTPHFPGYYERSAKRGAKFLRTVHICAPDWQIPARRASKPAFSGLELPGQV